MTTRPTALAEVRWDDVRVFLALFRERNLAGAAARLGLDPSTLSRRLVGLEEALGARLFDRTREGLVPTTAAEQVLPSAEEVERGMLGFARAADALEVAVEGVVRITAPPGLADGFIAPALGRLLARHPRLRIELDASTQVADLTRREADLALRTVRPRSGDLVMVRLTGTRWRAMTSAAYAAELGTLERWSDARWIGWGAELSQIGPSQWLGRHAPGVEPVLRSNSFAAQLAAAESGLGLMLVPESFAVIRKLVPVAYAPALEASAEQWPKDELWLVGHRALREVPRVAAVWQFLADELAALNAPSAAPASPAADRRRRGTTGS